MPAQRSIANITLVAVISGLTSAVDDNDSINSKLTVTGAAMAEKRRLFRLKVVFRLLASCPALVGSMFKNSLGDILDYTGVCFDKETITRASQRFAVRVVTAARECVAAVVCYSVFSTCSYCCRHCRNLNCVCYPMHASLTIHHRVRQSKHGCSQD